MMPAIQKDPLLSAAKVLIVLIQIVVVFAMVMIGIGIGALLSVGHARIVAEIAAAGAPAFAYWLLIAGMAVIFGLLALAYRFFKELTGITNSVGAGDPFQIENADRLTRMGWISVAVHGVTLLIMALAGWFAPYLEKAGHHADFGFDLDIEGILLTLILFILARVFRQGAMMRAELEGTV
ncbi:MAG: DUF2975 domain-containing protein [Novosphingobium sp.]|uniref:DUF2975 domain-containing protein n=1 Tax=Novosphingobium sp. TaxID=1874826 RepID=UPI003C7C767B